MKKHNQGFTLIELSIVLVIIGLIVGGVLVGQDLIKGAEIRATVSQIEKYNAAVNTFRGKYNGMPGDLRNATNFGFVTRTGAAGRGDGNGLLESGESGALGLGGCGETLLFWRDMFTANMIADTSATATDAGTPTGGDCTAYANQAAVNGVIPQGKMGKGNMIAVFASGGLNYFYIAGISAIAADGSYTLADTLSPQEGFQIDSKLDDGVPITGTVRAYTDQATADAGAAGPASGSGECVDTNLTPDGYATATATRNENGCQLRLRASF